jgi:hypothetical protein
MASCSLYEEMIESCLNEAQRAIAEAQNAPPKNALLPGARGKIDQALTGLSELQRELLLLPTNERQSAQRRFQQLRSRVTQTEEALTAEGQRLALLGDSYNAKRTAQVDHALARTAQMGEESVEIGERIIGDLSRQREKLTNAHGNLDLINTSVKSTGGLVGKMAKVQRQNNLMKWGLIVLMIIAIGIVLYLKFF